MDTLFKLPDPVEKPEARPARKERCRHCKHMYTHAYNTSYKYCRKQPGHRTAYGHAKVKALDYACEMFEPIED